MDKDLELNKAIKRAENLFRQRKEILSLPPEKALDRILEAHQPAALVHSFPEEDLYFLIHDIGAEDSLPLLSLASDRQWEYVLDIEVWDKDRIETRSVTRWLDLFLRSDPNRFIKWALEKQTEFIEFYLFKNIEVIIREHDQDPSDFGDEYFTYDDTFYVRFLDYPAGSESEHVSDSAIEKDRDAFLLEFLKRLAAYDHAKYQQVLLESLSIISPESEEEAYRQRNISLAEKGFLPFEEAIGVYQHLDPKDLEKQEAQFAAWYAKPNQLLPVPLYSVGILKKDNLFSDAVKRIAADDVLQRVQTEFAGLCNQVIVADQKAIRSREELEPVVKKVSGYISIGLERLTKKEEEISTNHAVALVQKYPLSQIFRVGYGLALELKWRARRWQEKSWFAKQGLPLSFWGEEWIGVLGGLLIKKPLFFDNYTTGVLYREFNSSDEIIQTDSIVSEIIAFDNLLSLMTIELEPISAYRFLTYKNLVLTLWARQYLGLTGKLVPMALDEFKPFFDDLWEGKAKSRKIKISKKELFLNWLSSATGLTLYKISQWLGQTLENIFGEIESELGQVLTKDLDPKYVQIFLLKP